ncbi:hypothetical protein GCM10018789_17550 [Streptomyces werraensis]|nr:hypothetical protein GCM10018789_17550 [Streptomyces werraensis]
MSTGGAERGDFLRTPGISWYLMSYWVMAASGPSTPGEGNTAMRTRSASHPDRETAGRTPRGRTPKSARPLPDQSGHALAAGELGMEDASPEPLPFEAWLRSIASTLSAD